MEEHEIPGERARVNGVFDKLGEKIKELKSENGLSTFERDKKLNDLIEFNELIREKFLKEWHMVEAQDRIIQKLEYYLEVLGHDVDSIRLKIMDVDEITDLLKKGRS